MITPASLSKVREDVVPTYDRVTASNAVLWKDMAARVGVMYAAVQTQLYADQHGGTAPPSPPPSPPPPPKSAQIAPATTEPYHAPHTVQAADRREGTLPLLRTNLKQHVALLSHAAHALQLQASVRTSRKTQEDLEHVLECIREVLTHVDDPAHQRAADDISTAEYFQWARHLLQSDRLVFLLLCIVSFGRPLAPPTKLTIGVLWGASQASPYSLLWKMGGTSGEAAWLDSVCEKAGSASHIGPWVDIRRALLGRWGAEHSIGSDLSTTYPSDQVLYLPTFVDLYGRSYCFRGGSGILHPSRLLRQAHITLAVWDTSAASSYRETTRRESARHTVNAVRLAQATGQKRKRTESDPFAAASAFASDAATMPTHSGRYQRYATDPVYSEIMSTTDGGSGSAESTLHWWACRGGASSMDFHTQTVPGAGRETNLVLFPNAFVWAYPKLCVAMMGLEVPLGRLDRVHSRVGERYRHQIVRACVKDIATA